MDVRDMRTPYNDRQHLFLEDSIKVKEPFNLFHNWFQIVKQNPEVIEPTAVCLSTATKDGIPSARMVLCKDYDKTGFKFFTQYTSRKGQELDENPNAALTFYWPHYSRSVRVEGFVEKLPLSDADAYFQSRPYQSKITSHCSDQSKPIGGRYVLAEKEKEFTSTYPEAHVPRPSQWGGYILKPNSIEFWQGQTDRLHDRIRFRKRKNGEVPNGKLIHEGEDGWLYQRLSP